MDSTPRIPEPARSRRGALLRVILVLVPLMLPATLRFSILPSLAYDAHGEMIEPPRALPDVVLKSTTGKAVKSADLHDRWVLMFVAAHPCDANCARNLIIMHEVHLALGDDGPRMRRVVLQLAGPVDPFVAQFGRNDPEMLVLRVAAADQGRLRRVFPHPRPTDRLYLLDPLGNVLLRYATAPDPGDVHEDLERLLRSSWIS